MARKGYEKVSQREYARRLGVSNEAVSKAVREGRIKKGWNKKEEKIIVKHANDEFGFLFKSLEEESNQESSDENIDGQIEEPKITPKSSYQDLTKAEKWYDTQLKKKLLLQKNGKLVDKDEGIKQVFTVAKNMKISILAVPDRTIDNILSSKTRSEAHIILTNALHDILEDLTDKMEKINFE